MGFFSSLFKRKNRAYSKVELISENGNSFFSWNGSTFNSDMVRACINPKVKAISKLIAKQIKESTDIDGNKVIEFDKDKQLKFLLDEPNQLMGSQQFLEKMASQLCLNNNAFAGIIRNPMGTPIALYPLAPAAVSEKIADNGELSLEFQLKDGKQCTFAYADVIHLRQNFTDNDIFGAALAPALIPLLDVISTSDQSVKKAVQNGGVIKWLLKFKSTLRPEDKKKKTDDFSESYLNSENGNGVAAVDATADAEQINPHDYVPGSDIMEKTKIRLYSLFNTNDHIVMGQYTEDEWQAYFASEIQPIILQMNQEFSRKLFTRRDRAFGNHIQFSSDAWETASYKTRLTLKELVDRGALCVNDWRKVFGLEPVVGGDVMIRRLDTGAVGADGTAGNDNSTAEGGNDK